jgi:hypothetical protein
MAANPKRKGSGFLAECRTQQAARGCPRPPCRHFKNQSCSCLGSAYALQPLGQAWTLFRRGLSRGLTVWVAMTCRGEHGRAWGCAAAAGCAHHAAGAGGERAACGGGHPAGAGDGRELHAYNTGSTSHTHRAQCVGRAAWTRDLLAAGGERSHRRRAHRVAHRHHRLPEVRGPGSARPSFQHSQPLDSILWSASQPGERLWRCCDPEPEPDVGGIVFWHLLQLEHFDYATRHRSAAHPPGYAGSRTAVCWLTLRGIFFPCRPS